MKQTDFAIYYSTKQMKNLDLEERICLDIRVFEKISDLVNSFKPIVIKI